MSDIFCIDWNSLFTAMFFVFYLILGLVIIAWSFKKKDGE